MLMYFVSKFVSEAFQSIVIVSVTYSTWVVESETFKLGFVVSIVTVLLVVANVSSDADTAKQFQR